MRMCLRAALRGSGAGFARAALSPSTSLKLLAPRELRGESPFLPLARPPAPANAVTEGCLSRVRGELWRSPPSTGGQQDRGRSAGPGFPDLDGSGRTGGGPPPDHAGPQADVAGLPDPDAGPRPDAAGRPESSRMDFVCVDLLCVACLKQTCGVGGCRVGVKLLPAGVTRNAERAGTGTQGTRARARRRDFSNHRNRQRPETLNTLSTPVSRSPKPQICPRRLSHGPPPVAVACRLSHLSRV